MDESGREQLRRLALWLSRRRAVDEAVEQLTAYGPTASDRVHGHLEALRTLLEAERQAFGAFERAAPAVPQSPLPGTVETDTATVHSLVAARARRLS